MIEIKNLCKIYDHKGLKALDAVSLRIAVGELVCVIGPSGAGKSTLLRLITGRENFDSGELRNTFPDEQTVFLSQDWKLESDLSLEQIIEQEQGEHFKACYQRFRYLVEVFRLQGKVTRPINGLSMGQKARAFLIKNLVTSPKLLMLDEPFAHLDRLLRQEIEEELSALRLTEQLTLIIISHDLESALKYSDRLLFLSSGRVSFYGPPKEFYHFPPNSLCAHFLGRVNLIPSSIVKYEGHYTILKNSLGEFRIHSTQVSKQFKRESQFCFLFCRSSQVKVDVNLRGYKIVSLNFCGQLTDITLRNAKKSIQLVATVLSEQEHDYQVGQELGVDLSDCAWKILPI
jgi:putrescine transport system ATP-binding protein